MRGGALLPFGGDVIMKSMKYYGKKETIEFLNARGIHYELREHPAVYTVAEAEALGLPHPEASAKNLFLRDDKKRNYYLVTAWEHTAVNLKNLRAVLGARPLSFASPADLAAILGLLPGSVTPLGILNDEACRVEVLLDSVLKDRLVAMHPNENTATLWMQEKDLEKLVREHGNPYRYIDF